jgi:hypothetical protein
MHESFHRVTGIVFRAENLLDEKICENEVFRRMTSYENGLSEKPHRI